MKMRHGSCSFSGNLHHHKMKKLLLFALAAGSIGVLRANSYSYSTASLGEMAHDSAYSWGLATKSGLKTDLTHGMHITSAQIVITSLYDWTVESGDILYIDLLDNPKAGIQTFADWSATGDYFSGKLSSIALTNWTDPLGGAGHAVTLTFDFTTAECSSLAAYLLDPRSLGSTDFGIGFDPDCHYYDRCIKLKIETGRCPVPEGGATLALLGIALIALPALKRLLRA